MNTLTYHDLQFALLRTPKPLLHVMKLPEWAGKIFVGGGFLRSIVAGDPVNDIDVFVSSKHDAKMLADILAAEAGEAGSRVWTTDNAYTVLGLTPHVQIIHRWTFNSAQAVSDSFDFTCCCAAFWWGQTHYPPGTLHDAALHTPEWHSVCDPRFYPDVAAKRLIYRNPVRNEDAGGSMLRVLKYYQKGYRIPLDSLANVITRLLGGVEQFNHAMYDTRPGDISRVICGLLREVDPAIDPSHVAHLPAERSRDTGDSLVESQ